jgi:hypothetical protein
MTIIPDFFDRYHLPDGEYVCTMQEVEERFLFSKVREQRWKDFRKMLDRMWDLGLEPKTILINGSFVTGRKEPGDVDFAALIPENTVREALKNAKDEHDKGGIVLFNNQKNQSALRDLFGAHLLVAENELALKMWSNLFRRGKNGKLREPNPEKDPEWVKTPDAKGILKVELK